MAACFLTSKLLANAGFEHAFFTRHQGRSSGPYASLNTSFTVGDRAECVLENLELVGRELGVGRQHLFSLKQVHGKNIVEVTRESSLEQLNQLAGDALLAGVPGVACCVRTADCIPLLMADRKSGRVAAVHCGWRGILLELASAVVRRFRTLCPASDLIAAIGPHIALEAFEVSPDLVQRFAQIMPIDDAVHFPTTGKPHLSLGRLLRGQLERAGLSSDCIDAVGSCTFADVASFFSYRRDGQTSGRQLSAIKPR